MFSYKEVGMVHKFNSYRRLEDIETIWCSRVKTLVSTMHVEGLNLSRFGFVEVNVEPIEVDNKANYWVDNYSFLKK